MANSRLEADWNHTSEVLAMLHNAFRSGSTSAKAAADFHPMHHRSRLVKVNANDMKQALKSAGVIKEKAR